ncbi:pentapeptide repeat-containing protein [Methylobacterium sp. Gmos1]
MSDLRKFADRLEAPNWTVGGAVVAIILLLVSTVYAFSAGKNAAESVQMIYQSALVIAGLIGLPLAIWRSWTAHKQALTSQKQLEGFQKQIALLEAGAEADRLQKSTELLESDKLAVRIAGISILRNIAINTKHTYRSEAFQILKSYAKHTSVSDRQNYESSSERKKLDMIYKTPDDIAKAFEAILKVHDNYKEGLGSIDVYGIQLDNISFGQYNTSLVKFVNCYIYYSVVKDHSGATFEDCLFSNCVIEFDTWRHTSFDNCEFEDCRIEGTLDVSTVSTCVFKNCDTTKLKNNPQLPNKVSAVVT